MSFETIDRIGTQPASVIPLDGILISSRALHRKKIRGEINIIKFIIIRLGRDLAAALGLQERSHNIRLMVGSDNDAGKLCIMPDLAGTFVAKGKPGKNYSISINAASAKGLFSLDFDKFTREEVEVIHPENGNLLHCTFMVTAEFLDAHD